MQYSPAQRGGRVSLIRGIIIGLLAASAVSGLPEVRLLIAHRTASPVEESESEKEAINLVVTHHRRVRIKSDFRSTDGHPPHGANGLRLSRLCCSSAHSRHSLANGLLAPLIC